MANIRTTQVSVPQQYEDAARKQAIADALLQRSMQPVQIQGRAGGNPAIDFGTGMTQLGEALIALQARRKAAAARNEADSKMRDQNALSIELLTPTEKIDSPVSIESLDGEATPLQSQQYSNRNSQALNAATAGMDPREAQQMLSKALMSRYAPDPISPEVQMQYSYMASKAAEDREAKAQALKSGEEIKREQIKAQNERAAADRELRKEISEQNNATRQAVADMNRNKPLTAAQQQKLTTQRAADQSRVKVAKDTADYTIKKIDEILDPKNKAGFEANFGGYNAKFVTQYFPSDQVANVKTLLDSLKSDMKVAGLQLTRSAGGSPGAITEKEWPIMEQMLTSLDARTGEKDAKQRLLDLKDRLRATAEGAQTQFDQQWADQEAPASPEPDGEWTTLPNGVRVRKKQ